MTATWPDRIAAGESQTLVMKASFEKSSVTSLVAFANAQGGSVLVSVPDAGHIQGVTLGNETLNEWLGEIRSATSPCLLPDIRAHDIYGESIVEISIAEYPVKPVGTRGRYYKRMANSNQDLSASLRNKLVAEGFYLINAIEKYGSGFNRIRKAFRTILKCSSMLKRSLAGHGDFCAGAFAQTATARVRVIG